jgi:oligopeptide/dipeptide ABC transporter ATP-binding protein
MSRAALLEVRDLRVLLPVAGGPVEAVSGLGFAVRRGETLGIVGESGSGKSVTMLAAMGLLPSGVRVSGSVTLGRREILGLPQRELAKLRGKAIAMIFQDPLTALNPVLTIGSQLGEALTLHEPGLSRRAVAERSAELLDLVSIPEPRRRLAQYPHEFSGGMRQRAMIAMAVANSPDVLIADEPTTALDVTVQAQILDVLARMRDTLGLALIIITHNLGVVAGTADRVAVMYAGRIVEEGAADAVFAEPAHPYTRGLLAAVPRIDHGSARLVPIEGVPPSLTARPPGCAFAPRCPIAEAACLGTVPELRPVGASLAACRLAGSVGA